MYTENADIDLHKAQAEMRARIARAKAQAAQADAALAPLRIAKTKATTAKYYATHQSAILEQQREYRLNHPDKERARTKAWQKANPEKYKQSKLVSEHKRRERKLRGSENGKWSFTQAEWETLKQQLGHRCVRCWKTETELKGLGLILVPDHIVPLVKGGLNDITNIQPLCHARKKGVRGGCNNRKGKKYMDFLVS